MTNYPPMKLEKPGKALHMLYRKEMAYTFRQASWCPSPLFLSQEQIYIYWTLFKPFDAYVAYYKISFNFFCVTFIFIAVYFVTSVNI